MGKQTVNINFQNGMDQKSDPWQLPIGVFQNLQNTVFTKKGLMQKRNGYGQLTALPSGSAAQYLTTFNGDLTAIDSSILAYDPGNNNWVQKGTITPLNLSVLPLIRNSINQIQCDAAIAPNDLICTVYSEQNNNINQYKYAIANSVTGQNIVAPTLIPNGTGVVTGSPRVFILGNYFVIVFTNVISSTSHLQYISVSCYNPGTSTTAQDIASSYISATTLSWDGVVANNTLFVAFNTTSGAQGIWVTSLSISAAALGQTPATPTKFTASTYKASIISLCADTTISNPWIYINFYSLSNTNGFTAVVDLNLNVVMNPLQTITSETILNLASAAQKGTCTLYYEVSNVYAYDNAIASNFINAVSVTPVGHTFKSVFSSGASSITASSATGLVSGQYIVDNTTPANIAVDTVITVSGTTLALSHNTAGNSASTPGDVLTTATLSAEKTIIRSVGLASKAFIINGVEYFLAAYSSPFQPSYFMINGTTSVEASPVIVAKLAYENGGGYLTLGLPAATVSGDSVMIPYLYKDLVQALNTVNNSQLTTVGGVYSQTGINLGTFNFNNDLIDTVEIGSNLNINGGFGLMYDGYLPVEQNFFIWPDSVEVTSNSSAVTPTGTTTSGSNVISAVSSMVGIGIGASVTGTGIPGNQIVTGLISSNSFAFGPLTATGSHAAETITVTGNVTAQVYYYQVVYEWTDNQGNQFFSAPSIPVTITTSGANSTNTVTFPTLRLTMKVANPVKAVVYRWSAANQIYYQVTSISAPLLNSTIIDQFTFYDSEPDSSIIGNSIIYTNGQVVEDVNPPSFNAMTIFDTRAWGIDAEDPNLLWFSKQIIEGTPVEWSDLFTIYVAPNTGTVSSTGPVKCLAPMDDKIILFKANAIYYINGTGPDNTGANNQYSQPIFITSTVGCSDQQSIVLMDAGLMFQSDKGIWLLSRGLQASYIGSNVENFNSAAVSSANNIPATTQIRMPISSGQTLMYDYFFNQWGTFVGCPSISSDIYQSLHTYLDQFGRVFQETPNIYLDGSSPVLMSFKTGWINLAALQGYQRIYDMYILARYLSPHKILVQVAYDYNDSIVQSQIIQPKNFSPSAPGPFGIPTPFGAKADKEQWRIHTKQQLCESFQLTVTEVFDPSFGTVAAGGFTMSGIACNILVKKSTRPIAGANTVGVQNG